MLPFETKEANTQRLLRALFTRGYQKVTIENSLVYAWPSSSKGGCALWRIIEDLQWNVGCGSGGGNRGDSCQPSPSREQSNLGTPDFLLMGVYFRGVNHSEQMAVQLVDTVEMTMEHLIAKGSDVASCPHGGPYRCDSGCFIDWGVWP